MFVSLIISFRDLCLVTAALPMVTLTICFVSAYIFQSEEVHETHCKVYNIIPSISAITGVSPQRYLWRVCIALHIGPRFAIAAVYWNYYRMLNAKFVPAGEQQGVHSLIKAVLALNIIEIFALCCVTYVSNKENYRQFEKRGQYQPINFPFLPLQLCTKSSSSPSWPRPSFTCCSPSNWCSESASTAR